MISPADALIELWKILQPESGEDLLEAAKRIKHAYPYQPTNAEEGISVEDCQAQGDEPPVNASSSPASGDTDQAQGKVVDTWIEVWMGNQKYAQIANTQKNLALLMHAEAMGFPRAFVTLQHPYGPPTKIRADTIHGYFLSSPDSRKAFRVLDMMASDEMAEQVAEDDEDDDEGEDWKKGYVPAR